MAIDLPSFVRVSERLLFEIERAVARWPRYHKYAHGTTLRVQAMSVTRLAQTQE